MVLTIAHLKNAVVPQVTNLFICTQKSILFDK